MPYKLPPLSDDEIAVLTRWVKEGARSTAPPATETPLASLVDVLADLPKVALKVPAADPVASVAFSPDGRQLAAAVGRQVVLYDVATRKAVATLGDHPGPVTSVRFTPDGRSLVAAGGRAGPVRVGHGLGRRQTRQAARGARDIRRDPRRRGRAGRQDPGDGRL